MQPTQSGVVAVPMRPCLDCGQLSKQSRCPDHGGAGGWADNRDRSAQAKFRREVIKLVGVMQCQALLPNGARCPATRELQAHHTRPGDNDPATGLLLCRPHHRALDKWAR